MPRRQPMKVLRARAPRAASTAASSGGSGPLQSAPPPADAAAPASPPVAVECSANVLQAGPALEDAPDDAEDRLDNVSLALDRTLASLRSSAERVASVWRGESEVERSAAEGPMGGAGTLSTSASTSPSVSQAPPADVAACAPSLPPPALPSFEQHTPPSTMPQTSPTHAADEAAARVRWAGSLRARSHEVLARSECRLRGEVATCAMAASGPSQGETSILENFAEAVLLPVRIAIVSDRHSDLHANPANVAGGGQRRPCWHTCCVPSGLHLA